MSAPVLRSTLHLPPPKGWRELELGGQLRAAGHRAFRRSLDGLRVIAGREEHDVQGGVLHVSVSLPDRLPSWEQLKDAKEAFMGDVWAYQVLAPAKHYLNMHPYVLHLWARADGRRVLGDERP